MSITAFAYTGYSTVMLWRNATCKCAKAVEPNEGLLFHSNVRVTDLILSRAILESAGATTSTLLIGTVFVATGLIEMPRDILTMICGWLLLLWYTLGIGLMVGALSEWSDAFERFYHPALYFYLPISGAFFMVDWLPPSVQKYAVWVPTVTVTEMIRHGYWGEAYHTYEQPAYLSVLCLVLLLAGLSLCKQAGFRVEPQ
jgi:capsular polysaccharide transport system permease protein